MLEVVVTTGIPRGEYDHPSGRNRYIVEGARVLAIQLSSQRRAIFFEKIYAHGKTARARIRKNEFGRPSTPGCKLWDQDGAGPAHTRCHCRQGSRSTRQTGDRNRAEVLSAEPETDHGHWKIRRTCSRDSQHPGDVFWYRGLARK